MKLESLYITSFGNLADYNLSFNDGLNSYCENNGYGKSTITNFIRAMFYGLPKTTSKEFSRKRAMPYSKPLFGGYIIFKHDNKTYKIERTFAKDPTNDTLTVYLNGKETTELGDIPGETIFNLDEKSFNKTLFITPKDLSFSAEGELKSKLGHFILSDDDAFNYDDALEKLEKYRKRFVPGKDADKNGLIALKKKEIADLENKQSQLNDFESSRDYKKDVINKYNEQINDINKQIANANSLNEVLNDWEKYDKFDKDISTLKKEIDEIKSFYSEGIPSKDEIQLISNALQEKNKLLNEIDIYKLNDDETKQLNELKVRFCSSLPSEEELSNLKKLHEDYQFLLAQKDETLTEKECTLIKRFDDKDVDEKILDDELKQFKELQNQSINSSSFLMPSNKDKKKSLKEIVLALSSIPFIALAIALGILIDPLFYILSAIGFFLLILAGFIYLKNQIKNSNSPFTNNFSSELNNQKYNHFIAISRFLEKYSYELLKEEDIDFLCSKFHADYKEYTEAKSRQNAIDDTNKKRKTDILTIQNKLEEIYKKYHYVGYGIENYSLLNSELSLFKSLNNRLSNLEDNKILAISKIKQLGETITQFINKYKVSNIDKYLEQLPIDNSTLSNLDKSLNSLRSEFLEFKKTHCLDKRPEVNNKIDTASLFTQSANITKDRASLEHEVSSIEGEISKLDDDLSYFEQYKEELSELNNKYEITKKTIDYLKKAEESLKAKYIEPIKNSLLKYITPLEDSIGKKVGVDADFNIYFIEEGKQRDYKHLSDGELTIVLFCFKLAILDNIFTGEKPFIILDDLFAFLDKNNLKNSLTLLKKLSKNRQIIYFTCHDSRFVN